LNFLKCAINAIALSKQNAIQVILVISVFKKCNFILMFSTNLDQIQLIALTLTRVACWPIERGRQEAM
jgi:hypothetical protein